MNIKTDNNNVEDKKAYLVVWGDKYATGIEMIDNQHKELVHLTNNLFRACMTGTAAAGNAFVEAMHKMVDYVRFHFGVEIALLERIGFPGYNDHKKEHETLIKQILASAKEYEGGARFVPYNFTRTLKDWVFGHIAISDKIYAAYVKNQKKQGLLSDEQINEQKT